MHEINKQAVSIAQYFYNKTNKKPTVVLMKTTIGQAKNLLNTGFTMQDIEQGIDWCVSHPPKNGFNSLGWLCYELNNILPKIKAKAIKDELENNTPIAHNTQDYVIQQHQVKNSQERVSDDFDFNIFGGE